MLVHLLSEALHLVKLLSRSGGGVVLDNIAVGIELGLLGLCLGSLSGLGFALGSLLGESLFLGSGRRHIGGSIRKQRQRTVNKNLEQRGDGCRVQRNVTKPNAVCRRALLGHSNTNARLGNKCESVPDEKEKKKRVEPSGKTSVALPSRRFRWQKPSKKIMEAGWIFGWWGAARNFWFDKTDSDSNDTCQASN